MIQALWEKVSYPSIRLDTEQIDRYSSIAIASQSSSPQNCTGNGVESPAVGDSVGVYYFTVSFCSTEHRNTRLSLLLMVFAPSSADAFVTAFLERVEDRLWNLHMKSSLPSATDMLSSMWNPRSLETPQEESDNGDERFI